MRQRKKLGKILASLSLSALLVFNSTYTPIGVEAKSESETKVIKSQEEKEYTRFIIKYKTGQENKEISQQLKGKVSIGKKLKNTEVITSQEKLRVSDLMSELKQKKLDTYIEYIQPDYEVTLSSNDPLFNSQWGIGSTVSGEVYGSRANVVDAWEESQGEGVTVAVIDTGIDINHEDLQENIWVNTVEIPGNGIDDDGSGHIDDVNGWNFNEDNNVVNKGDMEHGTHIAGIIAAVKDNGKGIAGVAPKAKVMPLKVFNNGQAYTSDIVEAIGYAEKMGVKVVNCSWGSSEENPALKEAIENSNMLFVCAAGNNGVNIDTNPVYPASYPNDNIITVGAMDKKSALTIFSNYGENGVDIVAPGEGIISTLTDNSYDQMSGTSMAAAFVSGEAVLLWSKNSSVASSEIKSRIIASSDKMPEFMGKVYQGCKINFYNAINDVYGSTVAELVGNGNSTVAESVYSSTIGEEYTLFGDAPSYSTQQTVTSAVFSVPSGSVNGQMNSAVQGKTLINLLGEKNYFYKWWQGIFSFDDGTLNSLSNTNNIITTNTSEGCLAIPGIHLHKDKKYLLRADIKVNSIVGSQTVKLATTPIDILLSPVGPTDNSKIGIYQTITTLLKPNSDGYRDILLGTCYAGGIFAQINFDFKNLALYEITDEEYGNQNIQSLLNKYPFISGNKSTANLRINSVGKNLLNTSNQQIYIEAAAASTAKLMGYVKVKRNTNYTLNYEYSKISGFTDNGSGGLSIVASNSVPAPVLSEWFISTYSNLYTTEAKSANESRTVNTGNYEYIGLYLGVWGPQRSTVFDLKNVSCLEGASPMNPYESHRESTLYLQDVQLHSLPNGIKDEINLSTGEYIKRVEKLTLDGVLNWYAWSDCDYTGFKRVDVPLYTRAIDNSEIVFRNKDTRTFKNVMPAWATQYQSQVWNSGTNGSVISLTLADSDTGWGENYIPSPQDIKNYFNANPHTIYLQLAQPEVYKLNTSPLISFEGGTIIVDNAVKSTNTYGQSGITIEDKSFPMKSIERVYKLNGSIMVPVDLSKVNVASNGLSFSIAGAKIGELYEYVYTYDGSLSTVPTVIFTTPTNSQAQISDNTEMINKLIQEIEQLKQELNAIKADRTVQYEYDSNGRLVRRQKN